LRLLILRHAIAEDRAPGLADADRALTPEGVSKFERAAAGLARIVDPPDVLLTSPLKRARQTADIASRAWGRIEPVETAALAGGTLTELAKAVDAHPDGATVVLVGHEPHVSDLLARLLGSPEGGRLSFKKGGAALVELEDGLEDGGRLVWFLTPKVLRELA